MISRSPTGWPAAPQHGHLLGRASAHVGVASLQDLIPSVLGTNLSVLSVSSMGAQHDGEGGTPPKDTSSSSLTSRALLLPALYTRRETMPISLARRPTGASPQAAASPANSITTSTRHWGAVRWPSQSRNRNGLCGLAYAAWQQRMSPGRLAQALQRELCETVASEAFAAAEERLRA